MTYERIKPMPRLYIKEVLTAWPGPDWWTEQEIADHLADCGRVLPPGVLVSVLNAARRKSWIRRAREDGETIYLLTNTGEEYVAAVLAGAAT